MYSSLFTFYFLLYTFHDLSDVGDGAAAEAVDIEVALTVVADVDADFVGIVFTDNSEAVGDRLTAAFATGGFFKVDHLVAEYDSLGSGLRDGITAAEIGKIACGNAVMDDDKGTVAGDPDILVTVGCGRLEIKGMVGCGNGVDHFKTVAVNQIPDNIELGDRLIVLCACGENRKKDNNPNKCGS